MTIEKFAEQYRLRVRHVLGDGSERGDPRIPGRNFCRDGAGADRQLYFDAGALCLMLINCAPVTRRRWTALGGKLWLGDISRDAAGRRVQDAKVTGIPLDNAKLAIRLARVRPKRILSEAELETRRERFAAIRRTPGAVPAPDAD